MPLTFVGVLPAFYRPSALFIPIKTISMLFPPTYAGPLLWFSSMELGSTGGSSSQTYLLLIFALPISSFSMFSFEMCSWLFMVLPFAESQFYLPAPICYTIFFSGPLFIMIIDSTYFKIKMSKQQSVGVMLTGTGVLLTANGQALWAWAMSLPEFTTTFKNYKTQSFL